MSLPMNNLSLQLNDPVVEYYKPFLGKPVVQMPLLIGESRTPLSMLEVVQRRLELVEAFERLKNANAPKELISAYEELIKTWWGNTFYTSDGAVSHSDGRLKIVLNAQYARDLSPQTMLVKSAVYFSDDQYKALVGEEFGRNHVEQLFNRPLDKNEAKQHPVWRALLRGNQALLNEVVDAVFAQARQRFDDFDGKMMNVCRNAVPSEGAAGYLWVIGWLGRGEFFANCSNTLEYYRGLLVGKVNRKKGAGLTRLEEALNLPLELCYKRPVSADSARPSWLLSKI